MENSKDQADPAQQRLEQILAAINKLPAHNSTTVFQLAEGVLTAVSGFGELGRLAIGLAWAEMAANGNDAQPEQPRIVLADAQGRVVQ